jgi:hypothetical protein
MGRLTSSAPARRTSRTALLVSLLSLAACSPICGQISAQPIEGYWSWEGNGVQQIKSTSSSDFEGTIVKESTRSECPATVGRVVLKVHGNGTHYTGQDEWFHTGDCARKFSTDAVVDLVKSNNIAHLCSTGPFTDVGPVHDCTDLMRLATYSPS